MAWFWLNATGNRAPTVAGFLEAAGLPFAHTAPVPLDRLAGVLLAADVHLMTLEDAFVGYVMPSKVYACIASGRRTLRLMRSDFEGPVNIGSSEMVSINEFAKLIMEIAGKRLAVRHIEGPTGVRGRNWDNRLIHERLGWTPGRPLAEGLAATYCWGKLQVDKGEKD